MTPQPNAPDWRRLVSEAGAEDGAVEIVLRFGGHLCEFRIDGLWATATQREDGGFSWCGGGWTIQPVETATDAARGALDYIRAELRARMERDAAALKRLGGGE